MQHFMLSQFQMPVVGGICQSKELTLNFPVLREYKTFGCTWLGVKRVTLQAPLLEEVSIYRSDIILTTQIEHSYKVIFARCQSHRAAEEIPGGQNDKKFTSSGTILNPFFPPSSSLRMGQKHQFIAAWPNITQFVYCIYLRPKKKKELHASEAA
ncbi:unnamed protein product [Trifolium pratense]|uniref:Uncharacterized protein n=1 Tax=Trifolium pratense TaxID=57577 RepID=A0ACB0IMA1_TRIPR|nr:unnamed protein product [Trifolium pratense]